MALLIYTRRVLISPPQIKAFNEASDEVLTGPGPSPGPWGPWGPRGLAGYLPVYSYSPVMKWALCGGMEPPGGKID